MFLKKKNLRVFGELISPGEKEKGGVPPPVGLVTASPPSLLRPQTFRSDGRLGDVAIKWDLITYC